MSAFTQHLNSSFWGKNKWLSWKQTCFFRVLSMAGMIKGERWQITVLNLLLWYLSHTSEIHQAGTRLATLQVIMLKFKPTCRYEEADSLKITKAEQVFRAQRCRVTKLVLWLHWWRNKEMSGSKPSVWLWNCEKWPVNGGRTQWHKILNVCNTHMWMGTVDVSLSGFLCWKSSKKHRSKVVLTHTQTKKRWSTEKTFRV